MRRDNKMFAAVLHVLCIASLPLIDGLWKETNLQSLIATSIDELTSSCYTAYAYCFENPSQLKGMRSIFLS